MPYLDVDPSDLFGSSTIKEFEQISLPELIIQQDSHVSEEEEAINIAEEEDKVHKDLSNIGRRQVLHLKRAHQA